MRRVRVLLGFLALLLCAAGLTAAASRPAATPGTPDTRSAVTAMEAILSQAYPADAPGAAVIVMKDGKPLLRKGYGMADLELRVPIRPEMVFRIGSVTKQFTSAAIMMLVEQGKISLDDDITKFLPDYPAQGRHISVEHLLTHTSGIKSYTNLPSFPSMMRNDLGVSEVIDTFKMAPMEFGPGEKKAYNNSGYFLLGAIIEKVSGVPYADFVRRNIFEPLDMKHSYYDSAEAVIAGRARGYEIRPDGVVNAPWISMTLPYAAGALASNVDDLALWDAALYTERLLKRSSLDRVWTPYKLRGGESTGYGYGWDIQKYEGHPVVAHGGGINGFLCYVLRMPEDHVYVALLTNFTGGEAPPEFIAHKLAALAIGVPVKEPVAIRLDPATLDRYVGVYRIDSDETRTITREGDRLFARRTGGPKSEIFPLSEDEFFYKNSFSHLLFVRDDKGVVIRMVARQDGKDEPATKLAETPQAERTAVVVDPALYDDYAGRYELVPGFVVTITREETHLMAQASGQAKFEIFPETQTKFFYKVVDAQITFVRDAAGAVTQLILHQAGRDMPARRIP